MPWDALNMDREYHKWYSARLGREMELLVFGRAGMPVLVFPTSGGRFYEFEDRGMVCVLESKIDAGQLQLFCVDSVDLESWYNRQVPPRRRIVRHMQYEDYLLNEVVTLVRQKNPDPRLLALGCSFGGYHAVNIALRHPEIFTGFLSMSGAFDLARFLDGYCDQDCYLPLAHALPAQSRRSVVSRSFSQEQLCAGYRMGRPVPGPEPGAGPHPEREGNPASALHLGCAERARLAHMAADGGAVSVKAGNKGTRERGLGTKGLRDCGERGNRG